MRSLLGSFASISVASYFHLLLLPGQLQTELDPVPAVRSLPPAPSPPPQRRGHALQPTSGENVWNSVSALGSGQRFSLSFFFFYFDFLTNFDFHVNSDSFELTVPDLVVVSAMASSPQKSPSSPKSPTPKSPSSRKKDDSFLGKLGGTLVRRKKAKEGKQLTKLTVQQLFCSSECTVF